MKFGGSSLADGSKISHVADLIKSYSKNSIVVVVSAMGEVTDRLLEASEKAERGDQEYVKKFSVYIREIHLAACKNSIRNKDLLEETSKRIEALCDELYRVLTGVSLLKELTPKSKDYILSFGERLSSIILGGALRDRGLKVKVLTGGEAGIVTDSNFGEANPLTEATFYQVKERIEALISEGIIPVITGYIAEDQYGKITTLGRGGSDLTATLIAASLKSNEVWIWTDVEGLMVADPKIIPEAKVLPKISYEEATEMVMFGAKGMHPRALEPAMVHKIPILIKNTFNPEAKGTLICDETSINKDKPVKMVALIKDVGMISLIGGSMVGARGTAAQAFTTLAKQGINIMMISQSVSESDISIVIKRDSLSKAVNALELSMLGKGIVRDISYENDVYVLAIVGAGIKYIPGVAARVLNALAKEKINVYMISAGSSSNSLSVVIKEKDGYLAVKKVYEEFNLGDI